VTFKVIQGYSYLHHLIDHVISC